MKKKLTVLMILLCFFAMTFGTTLISCTVEEVNLEVVFSESVWKNDSYEIYNIYFYESGVYGQYYSYSKNSGYGNHDFKSSVTKNGSGYTATLTDSSKSTLIGTLTIANWDAKTAIFVSASGETITFTRK